MYKVRQFTDEELKFSQDVREAFETVEKLLNRLPDAREKPLYSLILRTQCYTPTVLLQKLA